MIFKKREREGIKATSNHMVKQKQKKKAAGNMKSDSQLCNNKNMEDKKKRNYIFHVLK